MILIRRISRKTLALGILIAAVLAGCANSKQFYPPSLSFRDIAKMKRTAGGEIVEIADNAWLFTPSEYSIPDNGEVFLSLHFHTDAWFAADEHTRRGSENPLLVYAGLTGSSAYRRPFEDGTLFPRLLDEVALRLASRGERAGVHVGEVEISSFSAGYGAVREILRTHSFVRRIRTIVLVDSLYAGYTDPDAPDRRPVPEQMAPFIDFARLAARGEKRFLITYSSVVPGLYASTAECALAVVEGVGGKLSPVPLGSHPSAAPLVEYPLIARYDQGGLHVWGYAGDDGKAHMAHARALADFWRALEEATAAQLGTPNGEN